MKFVNLLLLITFLASCSKVEKVAEQTKDIAVETEKVADRTKEVVKTTNYAIKIQRQNDSAQMRSNQFEILMSERTGMGQKLNAASLIFKNFEYQLWNPKENTFDTLDMREVLKQEALTEFFQKLGDIYQILLQKNFWGKTRLERMSPLELDQNNRGENKHNIEMVFYALASMGHYNNIIQVKAVKEHRDLEQTESIYDLIRHALIRDRNGEHLTSSDDVILTGENRNMAINLLKARFNILVALATKDMATTEGLNFDSQLSRFWYGLFSGELGSLAVRSNFENANLSTQKNINAKLSAALKAKQALERAGLSADLHKDLKSMIRHIQTDDNALTSTEYSKFLAYINALTME